jgi:fructosamine-3-kinase
MPVFRHDKKRWQRENPAEGIPAIFDPATYYVDRECDLAMTEIFGGSPASLYNAYYVTRLDLYNLYHILNRANLFGGDMRTRRYYC